jgi:mono/diheme cytochrome c family protein
MTIKVNGLIRTVFLLGTASLFACGAWAADAAAGKTTFASRCRTCHGANGEGNPAMAKALNATIKPLGSAEVQGKSDADLKTAIQKGTGKMKPVALSDTDAENVVAFIRTLKQ